MGVRSTAVEIRLHVYITFVKDTGVCCQRHSNVRLCVKCGVG
jgi:hypothetical protein